MNIDFKYFAWTWLFAATCTLTLVGTADATERAVLFGEFKAHKDGVSTVQFGPDGRALLTASRDGSVRTWNVPEKDHERRVCRTSTTAGVAAYTPDGQWVVTSHDEDELHIHDAHSGSRLQELEGLIGTPLTIGISDDGRYIAAGGTGKTLTVWRSGDTEAMYQISAHDRAMTALAFSPDGEFISTISEDGSLRVWEVISGYLVFSVKLNGPLNDVEFTPDGQHVLVAGENVKLIELKTSSIVRTFEGHSGEVYQVAVSPGGKYLATASSDRTARLWSVTTGRVLEVFSQQEGEVTSVAFSPDGNYLATGSSARPVPGMGDKPVGDNGVIVWNISEVYPDGRVSRFVERELYHWQRKGEFEKQTDYEKRIATVDAEAGKFFAKAYRMYAEEIKEGARIGVYDADNERFTIHLPALGPLSLRVPFEKAETFKQRFPEIVFRNFVVEPEVRVPDNSAWSLKRVELYLPSAKQSFFYESVQ